MATNKPARWVGNINGALEPFTYLGLFQSGDTMAVKRGELLEFTGNGNTAWVPIDSDLAANSNLAIANEEIKAGDRAGYYEVIMMRPGDIFEFDLASASAIAYATALYFSDSETFATSGSNIIGYSIGQDHYPQKQGHLVDDASGDSGTTIRSTSTVKMIFREAVSIYSLLQTG